MIRGNFRYKKDGADGAVAGDTDAGYLGKRLASHFDDGEQADIGVAGLDAVGAFGGEALVQLEGVAAAAVFEAPY